MVEFLNKNRVFMMLGCHWGPEGQGRKALCADVGPGF